MKSEKPNTESLILSDRMNGMLPSGVDSVPVTVPFTDAVVRP